MATSSDTAILIAGISLGVSAATFLWKIVYDVFFDAPRLRVTLDERTITGYQSPSWDVYVVSATNVGRRPTVLTSLWLCCGRPWRWWRRLVPMKIRSRGDTHAILLPDQKGQALSTKVPGRLDVGEQAVVFYDKAVVDQNVAENQCRSLYGSAGATSARKDSRRLKRP